ncbi:MAG: tRNA 5-methoxyuridine(34)/uridine 5-oxyacetic acid(34) synthase CmoB [Pseudomonadota bacterium]
MVPPFCPEHEAQALAAAAAGTPLAAALPALLAQADAACAPGVHGDLDRWGEALGSLPVVTPSIVDVASPVVRLGREEDLVNSSSRERVERCLEAFIPWRKGPFSLCGVSLDTEWRCDLKWDRVRETCAPLKGRRVLDVGCGNGYYALRMLADDPACVLGLDPYLLYAMQYRVLRHFLGEEPRLHLLPLPLEALPQDGVRCFDSVFSMGVLYHRRSPMDHLQALRRVLAPGGEVVLETLVIDGGLNEVLVPEGRYASMRNVWFLPSVASLESWLRKAGLREPQLIDLTPTTPLEQRTTRWMPYRSLEHFLDSEDRSRTVEGHPAPLRAVMLAKAP